MEVEATTITTTIIIITTITIIIIITTTNGLQLPALLNGLLSGPQAAARHPAGPLQLARGDALQPAVTGHLLRVALGHPHRRLRDGARPVPHGAAPAARAVVAGPRALQSQTGEYLLTHPQ